MLNYPTFNEDLYYHLFEIVPDIGYLKNKIIPYDDKYYSIFTYVTNGSFDTPEKRECRGSMAEISSDGKFIKWVCRPFEKFFEIDQIESNDKWRKYINDFYGPYKSSSMFLKIDGSIISSFIHNEELDFKSNASINNDFSNESKKYIDNHPTLKSKVFKVTNDGYSVIFEITLKKTPVIIPCDEDKMTIIGVRKIDTGEYWDYEKIVDYFGEENVVEKVNNFTIEDIRERNDIEGVVILYDNGLRLKVKTYDYLRKHYNTDRSILSLKKKLFYSSVTINSINNMVNRLKQSKYNDSYIEKYKNVAHVINKWLNKEYKDGLNYYNKNKDKDIKEYTQGCNLDTISKFIAVSMKYNKSTNMQKIISKLYARSRKHINEVINNAMDKF